MPDSTTLNATEAWLAHLKKILVSDLNQAESKAYVATIQEAKKIRSDLNAYLRKAYPKTIKQIQKGDKINPRHLLMAQLFQTTLVPINEENIVQFFSFMRQQLNALPEGKRGNKTLIAFVKRTRDVKEALIKQNISAKQQLQRRIDHFNRYLIAFKNRHQLSAEKLDQLLAINLIDQKVKDEFQLLARLIKGEGHVFYHHTEINVNDKHLDIVLEKLINRMLLQQMLAHDFSFCSKHDSDMRNSSFLIAHERFILESKLSALQTEILAVNTVNDPDSVSSYFNAACSHVYREIDLKISSLIAACQENTGFYQREIDDLTLYLSLMLNKLNQALIEYDVDQSTARKWMNQMREYIDEFIQHCTDLLSPESLNQDVQYRDKLQMVNQFTDSKLKKQEVFSAAVNKVVPQTDNLFTRFFRAVFNWLSRLFVCTPNNSDQAVVSKPISYACNRNLIIDPTIIPIEVRRKPLVKTSASSSEVEKAIEPMIQEESRSTARATIVSSREVDHSSSQVDTPRMAIRR